MAFGAGRSVAAVLAASIAIGVFLVGAVPSAGAETWYAQRLTGGDTPMRVEHFWSKGRKFRSETVLGGYPILTLVSGEMYYVIDPMRGNGIAVRRGPGALQSDQRLKDRRPFGAEAYALIEQGAERVGAGHIAGRPAQMLRITDNKGRRVVTITADELALPLRVEAFDRASGRTVRTDYVDWSRGLPLPDEFFVPAPHIKIEQYEYTAYLEKATRSPVGPAPILHADLFHGK